MRMKFIPAVVIIGLVLVGGWYVAAQNGVLPDTGFVPGDILTAAHVNAIVGQVEANTAGIQANTNDLTPTDVVNVTDHPPSDPPINFGTSRLWRTTKGVAFQLDTSELVDGDAHTLWMFIDESPVDHDGGPAGLEAFELRIRKDGGFPAPDGSGHFSGVLSAGLLPDADGISVLATADGSFDNPMSANILLLVRSHGPAIAGMEYEQTHNINGGCPGDGQGEMNMCVSIQEALHIGN